VLGHTLVLAGLGRGAREGRALAAEAQCWTHQDQERALGPGARGPSGTPAANGDNHASAMALGWTADGAAAVTQDGNGESQQQR
jgi:hypothetical protein